MLYFRGKRFFRSDELVGGAGLRRRNRWAKAAIKGGLENSEDRCNEDFHYQSKQFHK